MAARDKKTAIIGTINPEIITGPLNEILPWGRLICSPCTKVIYAGSAARVAFPLKKLGYTNVAIFSVVGTDHFAEACLRELKSWEIGTDGIERLDNRRTASCIAIVRNDAQRLYISDLEILKCCDDRYLSRQFERLAAFDFVLLTGLFVIPGLTSNGVRALFERLRARNIVTLLDPGWRFAEWSDSEAADFDRLLKVTDYILPNHDEIIQFTGRQGDALELMQALRAKGALNIVLKLGQQGAACLVGDKYCVVDPVKIKPLDTTAAGECFNAGVLHGLSAAMEPQHMLEFANRLAAHYVATGEYRCS
ncbi:MAG: carbohydrate kinase family protein [Kiritimatiellia bacterium]|nr:carbohydrate kinase family protein [Kiritimatiellia bacterium]